jgi:short-subunit dehydrogenase
MAHFLSRGSGHLVGISSVAKLMASGDAAAYSASKAFVSTYLDGLRDKARSHRRTIAVTEICPGFVDTAMMKADKPFWVASPAQAADCIARAIRRRARHAYVTPRWALIGLALRLLPVGR